MGFQRIGYNRKGTIQLMPILYTLVIIGTITISATLWMQDWNTFYGADLPNDLRADFDQIDSLKSDAQDAQEKIAPVSNNPTEEFESTGFRGVFGIIVDMPRRAFQVFNMFDAVEERFGLPRFLGESLVTLILMGITAAIITIIWRRTST